MSVRDLDPQLPFQPHLPLYLGPDMTNVPESVPIGGDWSAFGPFDGELLTVLGQVVDQLRLIFRTRNACTFPMSGTGLDALQLVLANCLERGQGVVVAGSGRSAARMVECARQYHLHVEHIEHPQGGAVDPATIAEAARKAQAILISHGDTTTGLVQDLAAIGACRHEALLIVDASATIGGMELDVDAWNIDCCFGGTHRALACPPGSTAFTIGERALAAYRARTTPVPPFEDEIDDLVQFHAGRVTFHQGAPVEAVFGLVEALPLVLGEGLENRWRRHRETHLHLIEGLAPLGFSRVVEEAQALHTVTPLRPPPDCNERALRRRLLETYRIDVGIHGIQTGDPTWLIGAMGINAGRPVVDHLIRVLKRELR